jgi:hypothetical protein
MFALLTKTFQGSRADAASGSRSRLPAQQPTPTGRRRSGPDQPPCGGGPRPAPNASCRAHVGSQGGSRADGPLSRRLRGGTPAATRRAVQEEPLRSQRGGEGEGAEHEGREQRGGSDRGRDRGGELAFHAPTSMRRRNVGKPQSPQTAQPWDCRAPARFESERTGELTGAPTDELTGEPKAKPRSDGEAADEPGLNAVPRAEATGRAWRQAIGRNR